MSEATINRDDLVKAQAEAQEDFAKADAALKEYAVSKGADIDVEEMTPLVNAVRAAKALISAKNVAIEKFDSNERWQAMATTNRRIVTLLDKAEIPAPAVTGLRGTITIGDEIGVTATVTFAPADLKALTDAIAKHVAENKEQYTSRAIDSLTFRLTQKEDGSGFEARVEPKGASDPTKPKTSKAKGESTGERSGRKEFNYKGAWLGAGDFLRAYEPDSDGWRSTSFETSLRGTGNGLSNLARDAAEKLGIEVRVSE